MSDITVLDFIGFLSRKVVLQIKGVLTNLRQEQILMMQ